MTDPKIPAKRAELHNERIQAMLVKTAIALPLLDKLDRDDGAAGFDVIIDSNLDYPMGRTLAREWILEALAAMLNAKPNDARLKPGKNLGQNQYVFARLPAWSIRALVVADASGQVAPTTPPTPGHDSMRLPGKPMPKRSIPPEAAAAIPPKPSVHEKAARAVYQIWEDFRIQPLISSTISTVKADAARAAFKAMGNDVVWAVVDSGIDASHPHFAAHGNLTGQVEAWHRDFTDDANPQDPSTALRDPFGHGTHVAGIIAGEIPPQPPPKGELPHPDIVAYQRVLSPDSAPGEREITPQPLVLPSIAGMAPKTKLVSLRVLDAEGGGQVSNIIAALEWIQEINGYGRRIRVHGVNLSVGYPFDAEWFACGQSQLCVEVNRLVRSGVVVVVAAGNTGYGTLATDALGARKGGLALTINDPGNAELAITVGSTHRDMPHAYGVSYFSAKGPTGDGRLKPDLLAPGEKVVSCAAGSLLARIVEKLPPGVPPPNYIEYTGTSMAAPHASGCVAAFLSVKREFIGQPERVKEIFLKTATSLGRERSFEGYGLVDVMRAVQFI